MAAWTFGQAGPRVTLSASSEPVSPTIDDALDLQGVKTLFLSRSYKKCIMRCCALLCDDSQRTHPLRAAFLNFYIALSNDALARGMPIASLARQETLINAKQHYEAAEINLPAPFSLSSFTQSRYSFVSQEEAGASFQEPHKDKSHLSVHSTNSLTTSSTSFLLAPPLSPYGNESVDLSYYENCDNSTYCLSPLRIQKQISERRRSAKSLSLRNSIALSENLSRYSLSTGQGPFAELLGPLSAALNQYAADHPDASEEIDVELHSPALDHDKHEEQQNDSDDSASEGPATAPSTPLWSDSLDIYQHIHLFNEHLVAFHSMVRSLISSLEHLEYQASQRISETPATYLILNSLRPFSGDSVSNTWSRSVSRSRGIGKGDFSREEKRELRKERMRTWQLEKEQGSRKFNPERYQELCKVALAELVA